MRIPFTVAVLAAAIGVGCPCGAEKLQVDVYISGHDELLGSGTIVASAVYEKIGVHLNWHTREPMVSQGRPVYRIHTVAHAPESVTQGALASTEIGNSSGTEITVYRDRMLSFVTGNESIRCELHSILCVAAGYVLAHELAHLMQGVARHSESGILKAHWTHDEYREMFYKQLAFTQTDVELIHRGLVQTATRRSDAPANVASGNLAFLNPMER